MKNYWTGRDVEDLAYRASGILRSIGDQALVLVQRASRDQLGVPTRGDGPAAKNADGGANNGNVPGLATLDASQRDPVGVAALQLIEALIDVNNCVNRVGSAAAKLRPAPLPKDRGRAGEGHCVNCAEWHSGMKEDRLKSGRCNRCRLHRLRTGREWNEKKGEQPGVEETPGHSPSGAGASDILR